MIWQIGMQNYGNKLINKSISFKWFPLKLLKRKKILIPVDILLRLLILIEGFCKLILTVAPLPFHFSWIFTLHFQHT